jgi:spermidine/putrescine transport system ATP-binding protein
MISMSDIVTFKEITKQFGSVTALDDITLRVKSGEFLSLLGPSGCGKTTLLRTLAGLERPDKGRVFLDESDITDVPPHKRPVNMVFQRWALFPHKTVAENIAFGLEIKKMPRPEIKQKTRDMLSLVKMEGYEDRFPRQLSGGQAQRIALARALIMEPRVLLLDEPLGSLDLKLRKEMQIELISIHKRLGMTFIYVTHDQEEALTMSDRIVVMNQGVIIQDGSPTEIYQQPNSIFAANFIGEAILLSGKVVASYADHTVVSNGNFDIRCCKQVNTSIGDDVTVCIRPERVRISAQPDGGSENNLQGRVLNTIFKGAFVHYQVLIPGDEIITIQQNLEQDVPLFASNSPIYLAWLSDNAIILTR